MLDQALAYAEAGWKVFPCMYQSKSPATRHGFKDATTDPVQIAKWWPSTAPYPHNMAIAIPEDIVVVDFDSPGTYDLAKDYLPPTAVCQSPRVGGGRHHWYKLPVGYKMSPLHNRKDGVDKLTYGSYVMVPPSTHPNGNKYEWVHSILDTPITDVPGWILKEEEKQPEGPTGVDPIAILNGVEEGGRQMALWRYACLLRRKGLTKHEAYILVGKAASAAKPPYTEKPIEPMVDRAWDRYPVGPDATAVRKIWKVNELIATDHGEIKWVIHGLLPQGFCVFTSDPKLGKSMIMGNLAKSISAGMPAFGKYPTGQCGVLYADMEQSEILATERWMKIANGKPLSDELDTVFSWDRIGEGGIEQIDNYLTQNPRVKMVVLDVLANIWPAKDLVSGTAYTKDYAIVSKLARLARDHKAAIVGVHHKVKNKDGKDGVMTASGSAGIVGAADTIWSLTRERDSNYGYLAVTGRNIESRTIRLITDGFIWTA